MASLRDGGAWLGAARNRIKWLRCCGNGEHVHWGSMEEIKPPLCVREVEEIAEAAANEAEKPLRQRIAELEKALENATYRMTGALGAFELLRNAYPGTSYPEEDLIRRDLDASRVVLRKGIVEMNRHFVDSIVLSEVCPHCNEASGSNELCYVCALYYHAAKLKVERDEARALNERHDSPSGLVHKALYDQVCTERDNFRQKYNDCETEIEGYARGTASLSAQRDAAIKERDDARERLRLSEALRFDSPSEKAAQIVDLRAMNAALSSKVKRLGAIEAEAKKRRRLIADDQDKDWGNCPDPNCPQCRAARKDLLALLDSILQAGD